VRFPYRRLHTSTAIPTLGGAFYRHKPILQVRLANGESEHTVRALLDTGADDTVFPRSAADQLGIRLDGLPVSFAAGAGSREIGYAIAPVSLSIRDKTKKCTWSALVGFRLDRSSVFPLLGHAGFFQFFTAEFHGDTHEIVLTPNSTFPGTLA
jgi:hypothetical protein